MAMGMRSVAWWASARRTRSRLDKGEEAVGMGGCPGVEELNKSQDETCSVVEVTMWIQTCD